MQVIVGIRRAVCPLSGAGCKGVWVALCLAAAQLGGAEQDVRRPQGVARAYAPTKYSTSSYRAR